MILYRIKITNDHWKRYYAAPSCDGITMVINEDLAALLPKTTAVTTQMYCEEYGWDTELVPITVWSDVFKEEYHTLTLPLGD